MNKKMYFIETNTEDYNVYKSYHIIKKNKLLLIDIMNDINQSLLNAKIIKDYSLENLIFLLYIKNLTHLTIRYDYNQEIAENILPKSLTHLTFKGCFNQKIQRNVLPNSLLQLTFGFDFN